MKKSRFTESKIVNILKQQESGRTVQEICREYGISQATFFNWKSKYGGMSVSHLKRLKELEEENLEIKEDVCKHVPPKRCLKRSTRKKTLGPAQKRDSVRYIHEQHKMSVRQACLLLNISSSVFYYQPRPQDDQLIIDALEKLVEDHGRWGFWMMYHHLRNEGKIWNHKRVYGVYLSLNMNLRGKHKKRLSSRIKEPLVLPIGPNITWSMDFMHDTLILTGVNSGP